MKIVFVNRFFFPDSSATSQMLSDLAIDLAQDHEVHVVTGFPNYPDGEVCPKCPFWAGRDRWTGLPEITH